MGKLPVGLKRDGTPQKRANQWTKAKEVQGQVNERDRDRVRAELLANRLEQHVNGAVELSPTQVQAAKILIDKGKPSLQAVEQTTHEEPASEGQIMASLAHLISQNPALLRPLIEADPGVRAALKSLVDGVPTVVDTQQTPKDDSLAA